MFVTFWKFRLFFEFKFHFTSLKFGRGCGKVFLKNFLSTHSCFWHESIFSSLQFETPEWWIMSDHRFKIQKSLSKSFGCEWEQRPPYTYIQKGGVARCSSIPSSFKTCCRLNKHTKYKPCIFGSSKAFSDNQTPIQTSIPTLDKRLFIYSTIKTLNLLIYHNVVSKYLPPGPPLPLVRCRCL